MTGTGTVLVVDDEEPTATAEFLEGRGLDVEVTTDLESGLAVRDNDCCCVVCGKLSDHSVPELVARLGQQSFPVVFAYRDAGAATAALDARAAATVPRREPDGDWGRTWRPPSTASVAGRTRDSATGRCCLARSTNCSTSSSS